MIETFLYFNEHPKLLKKFKTKDDERERYNVLAVVRGTKDFSDNAVILMGHMDTVGIDDFGHLKDVATDPVRLMKSLNNETLPKIVDKHLQSGEWYFGRGALDMKAGIASHLFLLKYYSEHPEKLKGNLIFLAACDEEDRDR